VLVNNYEPAPGSMSGKTILITGAAGGLGSAVARRAAGLGAELVLLDSSRGSIHSIYVVQTQMTTGNWQSPLKMSSEGCTA